MWFQINIIESHTSSQGNYTCNIKYKTSKAPTVIWIFAYYGDYKIDLPT